MDNKQLEILRQRAESGDAEAMWEYAEYCYEHPEVASGVFEYVEWAMKAAEAGNVEAAYFAGVYCHEHLDEPKAAEWFKKSLDAGNTAAA